VSAVLSSVKDKITVLKVLREAGAMPPLADIRRLSKVGKQPALHVALLCATAPRPPSSTSRES
jgi:hypothetical protein